MRAVWSSVAEPLQFGAAQDAVARRVEHRGVEELGFSERAEQRLVLGSSVASMISVGRPSFTVGGRNRANAV